MVFPLVNQERPTLIKEQAVSLMQHRPGQRPGKSGAATQPSG